MSRAFRGNLVLAVGMLLGLFLTNQAWSQSCCDESSAQCKSGQKPGDKVSCTVSGEVCVQFASECPKKKDHPGVLCDCGTPSSGMIISPDSLAFSRKSQTKSFAVSNPGNVPLTVDVSDNGDTGAFSVAAPKKCRTPTHAVSEEEDGSGFSVESATARIPAQGCLKFRVKFTPHRTGLDTDLVTLSSPDPPEEGFVFLEGSTSRR